MTERLRGEAYTGKGYGTLRYRLFVRARKRIESSIRRGYFCEAIAICESVIGDRLESRLSYLSKKNIGFRNLGHLIINLKILTLYQGLALAMNLNMEVVLVAVPLVV